jgi:excinuclease ABC subunit C
VAPTDGPLPGIDPTTGRPRKFAYPPNLLVVDGGAPQVAAAAEVLGELGITDVAVVGLAKRLEEVWLPGEEDPAILPRTSEALYLLQRVRDEAHRFAITHHRTRRDRAMTESIMDELPGVGPARKRALLQHFGSPDAVLGATREELERVPGLPQKVARDLYTHLNKTGR